MTNVELDCYKSQEMCEKVPNAFQLAKGTLTMTLTLTLMINFLILLALILTSMTLIS